MTTPWHEDESFWHHIARVIFSPRRWETACEEVDKLIALLKLPPGLAILDFPCGPGRHALEFARRGYQVTGVDITPTYLEKARERAEAEDLEVQWVQQDMRSFTRSGEFDLALNLFSSFGYFSDPDDEIQVLHNLFESLRPGGWLVMEMMGKEVLARNFRPRDWSQLEDGGFLLEERTVIDHWTWIRTRWVLLRNEQQLEHTFEVRSYAASELISMLREVGFTDLTAYGNLDGDPYDENAQRLIVLGHKAE